jgi:pimeloyl-ACP methyl ester carboxylesterase
MQQTRRSMTGGALLLLAQTCASHAGGREPLFVETGMIEAAPGVSIYYERRGDGPDYVFIPGRLFMPEMAGLARPNRSLVLYDMRNRGASGRVADEAALTILKDVEDLEALRAHFGVQRLALVGFSYLGLMTALYAADHPSRVTRLVQIGPVPRNLRTEYPPGERAGEETLAPEALAAQARWTQARAAANADTDQRTLCGVQRDFIRYLLVGDPALHTRIADTCVHENEWPAALDRHFAAHFGDIQRREFPRDRFEAMRLPVLTIHGTLDRNAPYGAGREWAATFPNGRLITVRGGAHSVWIDDPGVIADIDAFLAGRWPARAERIAS